MFAIDRAEGDDDQDGSDDGGGAVSEPDRRLALTDLPLSTAPRRRRLRRGRLRRLPRPSMAIWSRCAAMRGCGAEADDAARNLV